MAICILLIGESGTGKSAGMRNFTNEEVEVISVSKTRLPFKSNLNVTQTDNPANIIKIMGDTEKNTIIVDDVQYLLGLSVMRRSLEKGWDKFSEIQSDYFKVIDYAINKLPESKIVVFISHTETTDNGVTKVKTIGNMLDKYITIEGLFNIVIGSTVSDGKYYYMTQNDGKNTLKTPFNMFSSYAIENDLKYVCNTVRNFYDLDNAPSDEELAIETEKVAIPDIERPTRSRKIRKKSE